MRKKIIWAGILLAAAFISAVAAALLCTAQEETVQLEFTDTLHVCDHSEYVDTYDSLETAKQGVVRVMNTDGNSLSTAFAVGKCSDEAEYFLTAYHAVKDGEIYIYTKYMANASSDGVKTIYNYNLSESEYIDNRYKAQLSAYDEKLDIALIRTENRVKNIFPLKILDSSTEIIQGEAVYGLSFPVSEDKILSSDSFQKTRYADKDSITVLSGITAELFEGQDEFMQLRMNLSGGCSGSPVVLKNGAAAGMVKQGNFSIIIDPVREMEIYEPAGSGTAVKAADIASFLENSGVYFEKGKAFVQAGCRCELTETPDISNEKAKDNIYSMLRAAETLSTVMFGILSVIACRVILFDDERE